MLKKLTLTLMTLACIAQPVAANNTSNSGGFSLPVLGVSICAAAFVHHLFSSIGHTIDQMRYFDRKNEPIYQEKLRMSENEYAYAKLFSKLVFTSGVLFTLLSIPLTYHGKLK